MFLPTFYHPSTHRHPKKISSNLVQPYGQFYLTLIYKHKRAFRVLGVLEELYNKNNISNDNDDNN